VQPGNIALRKGHLGGSHIGVAPGGIGGGVGGNQARQDHLADPPREGQGGVHCEARPKLQHGQEQPAGTRDAQIALYSAIVL
jgi:hypothetical protein